jgi:branched-chain amino acid transport system permease protein
MQRNFLVIGLIVIALVGGLPLVVHNPYYIHLVETIMIYAIVLFGLDIVVGYTGQVSLGHAGLFGIGSYTAGVMVMKLAAPLWRFVGTARIARHRALFGDGDLGLWHHHSNLN